MFCDALGGTPLGSHTFTPQLLPNYATFGLHGDIHVKDLVHDHIIWTHLLGLDWLESNLRNTKYGRSSNPSRLRCKHFLSRNTRFQLRTVVINFNLALQVRIFTNYFLYGLFMSWIGLRYSLPDPIYPYGHSKYTLEMKASGFMGGLDLVCLDTINVTIGRFFITTIEAIGAVCYYIATTYATWIALSRAWWNWEIN